MKTRAEASRRGGAELARAAKALLLGALLGGALVALSPAGSDERAPRNSKAT
jgi:hypothetical protein